MEKPRRKPFRGGIHLNPVPGIICDPNNGNIKPKNKEGKPNK
jgi:hypothetical protein